MATERVPEPLIKLGGGGVVKQLITLIQFPNFLEETFLQNFVGIYVIGVWKFPNLLQWEIPQPRLACSVTVSCIPTCNLLQWEIPQPRLACSVTVSCIPTCNLLQWEIPQPRLACSVTVSCIPTCNLLQWEIPYIAECLDPSLQLRGCQFVRSWTRVAVVICCFSVSYSCPSLTP